MLADKLTVIFATLERPECALRLVRSIRSAFPTLRILIADQSEQFPLTERLATENGFEIVRMPYDAGVCASRNALVAQVRTPYLLLCDDDFILSKDTSFEAALGILDGEPDIGVVSGLLYDLYDRVDASVVPPLANSNPRNWERWIDYAPQRRQLTLTPIERRLPVAGQVGRFGYFEADAVLNWAILRRSMFDEGVSWDAQFKSNGEHEDFYLALKKLGRYRVVYTPEMTAYHHSVMADHYRPLRDRTEGWRLFGRKWGVDHIQDGDEFIDIATGARMPTPRDRASFNGFAIGRMGLEPGSRSIGIRKDGRLYCAPFQPRVVDAELLANPTTGELALRPVATPDKRVELVRYENPQLAKDLAWVRSEYQAVLRSTSWRLTEPLRKLSRITARVKERVRRFAPKY
jgi:GT2 family glycosyltransferase